MKVLLAVMVMLAVAVLATPVMAADGEWCSGTYDASKGTNFGRCSDSKPLVSGIQGTGADGGGAGAATGSGSGSGATGGPK